MHGRSFLPLLDEADPAGWNEVYTSHNFHEVYMYYPMRVVRERKYILILNSVHKLPFPFAVNPLASKTWQVVLKNKLKSYGKRSVDAYLRRPEFELSDLENNPGKVQNLADKAAYQGERHRLIKKPTAFQIRTEDQWQTQWISK